MDLRGKKIFVGLSGGVDSAVSAALLQAAGAEVTGVFIKGWYPPGMPCTWAAERRDAMRVAARLGIPFQTVDASAVYKRGVIDYLLNEYRAGRTPNPDVMCNREVKFGAFYRFAKEHGADAIATGHYRSGEKDQSYFLWAVPKDILAATIFPVGALRKDDIRRLATQYDLPVAQKRDSQGICFLGNVSVDDYLRREFKSVPGIAREENGRQIGWHESALLYTIGERIPLRSTSSGPWFVIAKDIAKNELIVARDAERQTSRIKNVFFTAANWHGGAEGELLAQTRYRGPRCAGRVEGNSFIPHTPLAELPAPGQSIVFYSGNELVGGGIITS